MPIADIKISKEGHELRCWVTIRGFVSGTGRIGPVRGFQEIHQSVRKFNGLIQGITTTFEWYD